MQVRVRYFAGARAAAGIEEEKIDLDDAGAQTVAVLMDLLGRRHGPELTRVLAACTFLVDEIAAPPERELRDGVQVDVLPPFAGG